MARESRRGLVASVFMRLKFQAKPAAGPASKLNAARLKYPIRVSSFVASVGAHCLGIVALLGVNFSSVPPEKPVYDEFIKPNEHKILFYDFRTKVPDIAPIKRVGHTPDPRGVVLSRQTIIANSPKPKSAQVFIWEPAPKIQIDQDLPAPLLVARLETTLPPPPAAPPTPRKFAPPPPPKQEPKLAIPTPVLEVPVPSLDPSAVAPQPAVPAMTFPRLSAPPPKDAPEALTAHSGNARADIAVASVHPSENANVPVPNGERPGRFSKAPTAGAAASGDADATASLTVPDLTIRNPKPEPAPVGPPTKEIRYADLVRSIPVSTFSAPLRPASRNIPQAMEAQFRGRNVYTIVIPMEHMPIYSGDWIMWFSDRESKIEETPVMLAPVPYRKLELVGQPPSSDRTGARVQLAALLGKGGRLSGITLLTKTSPAVQRAVLQDMTSWEFQPAARNGAPVDSDVVLEIPFNLPTAIAMSTQP
jgi:hypothetical protein